MNFRAGEHKLLANHQLRWNLFGKNPETPKDLTLTQAVMPTLTRLAFRFLRQVTVMLLSSPN